MIGLNLDDPYVLRRALDDIVEQIPRLKGSAIPVIPLASTPSDEDIVRKINELADKINLIISALNQR